MRPIPRTPAAALRALPAALASVAVLISLCAPWYVERASAPGLSRRHTLTQSFSGWQSLSGAVLVVLGTIVGLGGLAVLRALTPVDGLGAEGRRTRRARIDGALVTVAGLVCTIAVLATMIAPPAIAAGSPIAHLSTGARWGTLISLMCVLGLALAGLRMLTAAGLVVARLLPGRRALPGRRRRSAPSARASR